MEERRTQGRGGSFRVRRPGADSLSKIRVRLLGGFEVWKGDRQVTGFESQKVRALLAYLVFHRRRTFSRDHLAGLLWPERGPEAARHALRQAVYNLRSKLTAGGDASLVSSGGLEIGLSPNADFWLDVEAFEEALRRGTEREAVDPHLLTAAAQLYRGELLAGFFVKDSPAFEDWMLTQQVRLRDAAVEVLRKLIDSYRRRGEYRFGVHYARRLVAVEPLSEEAHRELMRLLGLSGQRNRALAHYEELLNLLQQELGVEPLEETRALYESILAEAMVEEAAARDSEPIGPLIPLVDRSSAYEQLREGWFRVLEGNPHLTLVTGEGGIGKTRLIKSFLDATTSQRRCSVLKGRCYELAPVLAYQPFLEVLRSAVVDEAETAEHALAELPREVLEDLVRLIPEITELRPELPQPAAPLAGADGRRRLFGSIEGFLERLSGGPGERGGDPVIVFLDDLHLAGPDTFDLLSFLVAKLEGPVWFLAACRFEELDRDHPLHRIVRHGEREGTASQVMLNRLEPAALEEVAESLVGEAQAAELAGFLEQRCWGLPLAMAEVINYLWDEGILAARETGRWTLVRPLAEVNPEADDLSEWIRLRFRRLPNSTRRLATLAAIMGQSFDAQLLQDAAEEHVVVVEVGLEILLKRWLIRQFADSWKTNRRERDIVLWAQGARRGSFEFAHKIIRNAVYHELNPLRRQVMHLQVAEALERAHGERDPETLSHHFMEAGQWERALPHLERAIGRAQSLCAEETARRYCGQAVEVLGRLVASARTAAQEERWREERERVRRFCATSPQPLS